MFLAKSISSSNAIALDSPNLLVLITGTPQSRQHGYSKSPTAELFDVDSERISIRHYLKKDEIRKAPIWVKLHHVPIVAYSEVGLSLITTPIRRHVMLDSYTSNMCFNSWGQNMYARAMIEVSADEELKKSLVVAIHVRNGKGHTLATVDIEYEWTTPRCSTCLIFDHVDDKCPKRPKVDAPTKDTDDGFVEDWTSNGSSCSKGTRIILGWNHNEVDVAVINLNDHSSSFNKSMREFKECVEEIKVRIVQRSSLQFTWSQKPKGKYGLLKKIDRIMANVDFNDVFVMQDRWAKQFSGYFMFKVVQRLKYLKKPLRNLLYDKGNFHANVTRLRDDLDMAQICLDADPFKVTLRENKATIVVAFDDALIMEERFLKQKAKIDWLQEGDSNLAYFQKPDKRRSEFPI
nr:hypothetical protein [Tanacetum cinerariifolium]